MTKAQAQASSLKVNTSVILLEGNEIVDLFTIDVSKIVFTDKKVSVKTRELLQAHAASSDIYKFRFHNSIKSFSGDSQIHFGGKRYYAVPIMAEGFESATKGSPPTPKLSLAVRGDGNPQVEESFAKFKMLLRDFDDLSGAKVTRIRTFSKHLDLATWYAALPTNVSAGILLNPSYSPPLNHDADENAIISQEVYFIDRKSVEDKNNLEFELASILDLQEVKVPFRIVIEKTCNWQYRGEGCCYESHSMRNPDIHGPKTILPLNALPLADKSNLLFSKLPSLFGKTLNNKGLWRLDANYQIGDYAYVNIDGINYYFVAVAANLNSPPPSDNWIQDQCSKSIEGCKLRWGIYSPTTQANPEFGGKLRFAGFPGVMKR